MVAFFSRRFSDVRKRLDRVEMLMISCARQKIVNQQLDQILKDLRQLRKKKECQTELYRSSMLLNKNDHLRRWSLSTKE